MDRWACVNVLDLPLQLARQSHPQWQEEPWAVVAEDRPQGLVTHACRRARQMGVQVGMRYGAALSLAPALRAFCPSPGEVLALQQAILVLLYRYSPHVEPLGEQGGVFFLDASGLGGLYPSLLCWAGAMRAALKDELGLYARAAVGFTRFGTFAMARSSSRTGVFADPQKEAEAVAQIPLADLLGPEEPGLSELAALGIVRVGDLLALPQASLHKRLGPGLWQLWAMASGRLQRPLVPQRPRPALCAGRLLDYRETSATSLVFLVKQLLVPLWPLLARAGEKLARLMVRLVLDDRSGMELAICPAEPTLEEALVLDLVRLRLESVALGEGVVELEVEICPAPQATAQYGLWQQRPKRDLEAASRALARVRAEFGEQAVVVAALREGHLPEARFGWVSCKRLALAAPAPATRARLDPGQEHGPALDQRPLMRRLLERPRPLIGPCWSLQPPRVGESLGAGMRVLAGPFVLSGGWWVREVQRAYYFLEDRLHNLLWAYRDEVRQQWFVHGQVE